MNSRAQTETSEQMDFDTSLDDARWLFRLVLGLLLAVLGAGLLASGLSS